MRKVVGVLVLVISFQSVGQIVDDSTELVYGPETTKFIYEEALLNNSVEYQTVDSSLTYFERQSIIDRNGRRYQDLGNFGTALFPVFNTPQELIGRTSGFNAFAPYARKSKDIRFYDTKSPYIDLFAYLGGGNRNLVNVDFSRNVREGWNLGFDFHNITSDKILANNGAGDRQTVSTAIDGYMHYKHQTAPYQFALYYSDIDHKVFELGGVRFGSDSTLIELFQYNNALLRLQEAQNARKETTWHLYHDYQLADQFQIYHSFDYTKETNTYQDFVDATVSADYDTYRDAYNGVFQINSDTTRERSIFSAFTNEAGIKGDLSSVFYRAYIKLRKIDFEYLLLDPTKKLTEKYIGGYARFNWKEKFKVIGEGEFLQGGEYSFSGRLASDLLNVSYTSRKYNVPIIFNAYLGNHYTWSNSFTPVFVNRLDGRVNINYRKLNFSPKATFTTYNDLVYFGTDKMPMQASSGVVITTLGADINLSLEGRKGEGFYFENEILFTNVSGGASNVIRVPELFVNARYYWRGLLFGDKVPIEFGVDSHARSSYFANGYDPVTQQFHLQDELETTAYYKADLFFNMRLDKFFVGLKWIHFDQPSNGGYFASPFYPGQPKAVDLIVRWSFFD